MDEWKPIDDDARDGRVILVTKKPSGETYAAYYGMANKTTGAGIATKTYPWVFLDPTNGLNGLGADGPTHYRELPR